MFYGPLTSFSDYGASQAASEAKSEASRAGRKAEQLCCDIERLLMITEALWTILKEQNGYDDNELQRRVREIDMRDGALDGRVAPTKTGTCPKCDRPLARKRPFCLYCGAKVDQDLFGR